MASPRPATPRPNDVFIAVMGMTGAGKSSFISHCTNETVLISEPGALESCTEEVQVHRCDYFQPNHTVYLVDTPGFDDTNRKDSDILKEIASWLTRTYEQKIQLQGILYLHRISDNRMGGCAAKNLRIFKQLCGDDCLKNVIFVTTFWEKVDPAVGDAREQELRNTPRFWGLFVGKGARIRRHMDSQESALETVSQLVPGDSEDAPEAVSLAIQTEMVDARKDLNQTAAGQEVESEIRRERERMKEEIAEREREIRETKDKELLAALQEEQEKQKEELRRRDEQVEELKVSLERMHEQKIRQLERRLQQQQEAHIYGVSRINQEWLGRMNAERAADRSYYQSLLATHQPQPPPPAPALDSHRCSTCGGGYDSPAKLRTHQVYRGHGSYGNNNFSCTTCGGLYPSAGRLEQHQKKREHGNYRSRRSLRGDDKKQEKGGDGGNKNAQSSFTHGKSLPNAPVHGSRPKLPASAHPHRRHEIGRKVATSCPSTVD